ncbi:MAG TPA: hypothetical protein VKP60_16495 [Magnetospirillaceae bacterium]|nr:hypothetical protein [Magnetospirillaceae bacterium]
MLKFIGKALAGMVLTKEAREAAGGLAKSAARTAVHKIQAGSGKPDAREQAIADAQAAAANIVTNDRAELIRKAMEVRAAKQSLLADLNDEDRAKLVATAMRAFLAEAKPKE